MAEEAQTERMQSDAWDGLIERWARVIKASGIKAD